MDPYLVLRLEPNDKDALQTKLFLLLQTEQYVAALALIGDGDPYAFERTYSLYRLQREAEAVNGLKTLKEGADDDDERGVLHLEAQLVRYKVLVITEAICLTCE